MKKSNKYKISKEIEKGNRELLKDIESLNELAFLLRKGKARIEVENNDI